MDCYSSSFVQRHIVSCFPYLCCSKGDDGGGGGGGGGSKNVHVYMNMYVDVKVVYSRKLNITYFYCYFISSLHILKTSALAI